MSLLPAQVALVQTDELEPTGVTVTTTPRPETSNRQFPVPEFLSITSKVGFWPDAYVGGPAAEDLSSRTSIESTQPDDPTATAPPDPPVPPTPPMPPTAPVEPAVGVPEPVGPVTGYEFMGGNVPVGTGPGVIIDELPVGVAEAPVFAPLPPPEAVQAYAVNPIRTSGIPNTRIRRRQYIAGGSGPTGRRSDPTERHPMAWTTQLGALVTRACSTMRR